MTAPAPLTEDQFILAAQIYGGDTARWPAHLRAAERMTGPSDAGLSDAARAALKEAAALDALLRPNGPDAEETLAPIEGAAAPDALMARILNDAARESEARLGAAPAAEPLAPSPIAPTRPRRARRRAGQARRSAAAAAALAGAMAAGLALGFLAPQWAQSVAPFVSLQVAQAEAADPYGYDAYDGVISAAEGWMDG